MKPSTFRSITEKEKQVFLKMLSLEFRGKADLITQIYGLQISQIDETLYKLHSKDSESSRDKRKTFGLPVEAFYQDKDGVTVYVDLFADEYNKLCELEVWKGDGSPIIMPFTDAQLTVRFVNAQTGTQSPRRR